jgi:DNA repair protein RadD
VSALQLRWYQRGALEEVMDYISDSDGSPCVELPTGAGKTPTMVALIEHLISNWPDTRIIVVAHVRELVEQGHASLARFAPHISAGIYSAGLRRRDTDQPVIYASIQSVAKKASLFGKPDFIFVDEAHRIPVNGDGQYLSFIRAVQALNPYARVVGFTATPYRLAGGEVCGKGKVLSSIVYRAPIGRLIDEGYLCRPVVKSSVAKADMRGVAVTNGDYNNAQMEERVTADWLIAQAVDEFVQLADGRNKWLIFGASQKHIERLSDAFLLRHNIEIPTLTDKTPTAKRNRLIDEFKAGKYRGMLNVNILSEGFDDPTVDCVGLFRPTKSPGLYYQQVGRGFRIHPSKADFLVLDFADNIIEHGPIDAIMPPGKKGGGVAPIRICPQCRTACPAASTECPECGFEFPPAERSDVPTHHTTASAAPILLSDAARWVDVNGWVLRRHEKPGKPPSLRVDYRVGMMAVSEWLCFEHGGMPRATAVSWWCDRGGSKPAPRSIDEAIARGEDGEIERPRQINVVATGAQKYMRVLGYRHA